MTEEIHQARPRAYAAILLATGTLGFSMPSEERTCSLLRTLAASKIAAKFLELGTGTGLSTSWILDGMDQKSSLTSIDNDATLLEIAREHLGADRRLHLVESDGGAWIDQHGDQKYDYVFADTWHGKYLMLNEVLDMLNPGGLYIIDDMLPQPNWPVGTPKR